MYNDYEHLYMIRQRDNDAIEHMYERYHRLIWKRSHDFCKRYVLAGAVVEDLHQEGAISFIDALYSYDEALNVGLAYYVQICVESAIKSALRKLRSKSYGLLDTSLSLDMAITEDRSLFLYDVIADTKFQRDPLRMSHYYEALRIQQRVFKMLTDDEIRIYTLRENGYSYKDIAYALKLTEKKIDNILQKVKRKLTNYL